MEDLLKKLEILHRIAGLAPVPKQDHINCDIAFRDIRAALLAAAEKDKEVKQP